MRIVVLENAPRGVNGTVNAFEKAQIGHVECTNDIGANRFGLVIFNQSMLGRPVIPAAIKTCDG